MKSKRTKKKNISNKNRSVIQSKNLFFRIAHWLNENAWHTEFAGSDNRFRKSFFILLGFLFILFLFSSFNAGVNGDDDVQVLYAEGLINFYATFGKDQSLFESSGIHDQTLHLYGGFFEVLSAGINRILHFEPTDQHYYTVRHVLVATMGFLTVLFCGLTAKLSAGYFASLVTALSLFLAPRFLGHSLMNPKDIPFALGYAMSIYFSLLLMRQMPKPKLSTSVLCGVGLGIALGVRVGGLLSFVYVALFLGVDYLINQKPRKIIDFQQVWVYLRTFLLVVGVGFFIALIFWPYALVNPIDHISEALQVFSDYIVDIKVLFSGKMVWSGDIPLEYLGTWMFLGTPVFALVGLLLFILFFKGIITKFNGFPVAVLLFAFIFPIAYALAKGSALYDGMRHFLFAYVMGITLVGISWTYLLQKLQKIGKKYGIIGFAVFGFLLLEPAVFIARNYQYPYVFFNALSGGIDNAFGNYELDYWGLSVRQAVEWMEDEGIFDVPEGQQVLVTSNFPDPISIYAKKYVDAGKLKVTYSRYRERYSNKWDYGIFVCRFMDGAYIRAGTWPTSESIKDITVNGKAISSIYKSSDQYFGFEGVSAIKNGNTQDGISNLQQEVNLHPDNEIAWQELSSAYLNLNQLAQAKDAADKCIALSPENLTANNNLGMVYLRQNNPSEAIQAFEYALTLSDRNTYALYYLALIYQGQNDLNRAVEYAKKAVESNPKFKGAYQLTADIYTQMGNPSMAEAYLNAMNNN